MFVFLLWIVPLVTVLGYLVSWPSRKRWSTRIVFDTSVLLALVFVCIIIRPPVVSDAREAAEAVQWRPYVSAIYVAALSVLFLSLAGTVRHFIFRAQA